MARNSTVDNLSRMLQILKLMSQEGGTTVTEIAKKTSIDRWTVRDMIDDLENLSPDGKGLYIEEFQSPTDKRQTIYRVPKDNLWSLTLPGMNLSDEEGLLLALMFNQSLSNPMLKDSAEGLKKKMNMFKNVQNYSVLNLGMAKKISTKHTQQVIIALLNAIRADKCVHFTYKPVRRDVTEYQLMPLGVFQYDGGYYLAAQKLPDGEYRTFGLERAVDVPYVIDYEGELPQKVSYEERFDDPFGPFGHGREFTAVMKFDSFHGFFNLEKNWKNSVKVETLEDESVIMTAKTHSYSGIKKWVLGFGSGIEVLEPQWFREAICAEHLKAAGMYKTEEPEEEN